MRHRTAIATLVAVLGGGIVPAVGAAVPSIGDGSVAPLEWSSTATAGVLWNQTEFGLGLPLAATVEVNTAADGSESGTWEPRFVAPAPLVTGPNGSLAMDVSGLEGRHLLRVVVPGVEGSPLMLGTLQLDRTPPPVSKVTFANEQGEWRFFWDQVDPLSGTDPEKPTLVEYNTSPAGDETGTWVPFTTQPPPGDAPSGNFGMLAVAGLPPGVYRSRVTATDRAGNVGTTSLGVVDVQSPVVSDVRLVEAPTVATQAATLAFTISDGAGQGVDPAEPVYAYLKGASSYVGFANAGDGRIKVPFREDGDYEVVLRAKDRAKNVGDSAPFLVQVRYRSGPTTGRPEVPSGVKRDPVRLFSARERPPSSESTRWAVSSVRRFHARRGVRFRARVSAARTREEWRDMLGTGAADRYIGYATFDNAVLLGPPVTAGLESVRRFSRRQQANPRRSLPPQLERDRMATALAVLLHESLHATGPRAREDFRLTPSGRAFEEGFTEAATLDLLPDFVRSLGGSPKFQRALQGAVRRYRPAYRRQVNVVLRLSTEATTGTRQSRVARRWRIHVADTWGRDRWVRLERATLFTEAKLRRMLAGQTVAYRHR